jgi:hypothetical protein
VRASINWEGAVASLFFIDPKEQLITAYMIQKRRGIAISREFKRMGLPDNRLGGEIRYEIP